MTLDFIGFLFGVSGSIALALNRPMLSRAAWLLYLVSNCAWIAYAFNRGESWLLQQSIFFLLTSVLGAWKWIVVPRLQAARRRGPVVDVTCSAFAKR
ncbi:hypothetical protein [Rubrivivax gelatinosus]|uniref:hypothetical protein n=1 Tax=Rubrivivax gelatinosus TaxID=28068 RepID=UPI0005C1E004|nr:hypothetical protein [Rubrivivax gelatinosus]MBG6083090.1 hypothetical protein [Rubrivivax gelatinosus]